MCLKNIYNHLIRQLFLINELKTQGNLKLEIKTILAYTFVS